MAEPNDGVQNGQIVQTEHQPIEFSAEAIETFRELRNSCPGRESWNILQSRLADLLPGLSPWDWPVVEFPGGANPYKEGTPAALRWRPDVAAQDRWRALEAAAGPE